MLGASPACTQRTMRSSRSAQVSTSGSPPRSPGSSSACRTVIPPSVSTGSGLVLPLVRTRAGVPGARTAHGQEATGLRRAGHTMATAGLTL